ncbi:hypothetical protein L209DRAFT_754930 [Thermothelomyces heterothallicus CBS 203.75]
MLDNLVYLCAIGAAGNSGSCVTFTSPTLTTGVRFPLTTVVFLVNYLVVIRIA